MSKTIDERVVEMKFDNANFESNVRTSMSTLDKLKNALKFDGAAKGIEGVNQAVKNTKVSGLGEAVDTVKSKFSAFEVVAITALANITNSVVNAGKQLVDSFAFEPIRQGFSEYELKMGAIQTIMASTGEDIGVVNKYLQELNNYADKTIYSFSDMTQNIGKFTNAGVKLPNAVKAIQGVSNAAAVAGANSNEASRAMYNFAQALSAGYVKLIDWKSIENANMATVEFKNALLDTAVAMGTVVKEGDKYVTVTTDANGKVSDLFDATHAFNESLSNQWITSEVLIQTLSNYSNDVREMTDVEKQAYEEKLRGIGYTEEQIKAIEELGKKAFDSAQDVKTFSQLMDTLKEAVGTGWADTFEIIFGNLEEAKSLWTGISEVVGGYIDQMSKARNATLKEWKDLGGRSDLFQSLKNIFEALKSVVKPVSDAIREMFPPITGKNLADLTKKLKDFTSNLGFSKEASEGLKNIIKLLLTPVKLLGKALGVVFTVAGKLFKVIGNLADGFLSLFAGLSKIENPFRNFISESQKSRALEAMSKILTNIKGALSAAKDKFLEMFNVFKSSSAGEKFMQTLNSLVEKLKTFGAKAVEGFVSGLEKLSTIDFKMPSFDGFGTSLDDIKERFNSFTETINGNSGNVAKLLGNIKDTFKDLFSSLSSDFNAKNVLGGITTGIFGVLVLQIVKFVNAFKKGEKDLKKSFVKVMKEVADTLKAFQKAIKAEAIKKLAIAIGILAASLWVIAQIPADRLKASCAAMMVLAGVLVAVAFAVNKLSATAPKIPKIPTMSDTLTRGLNVFINEISETFKTLRTSLRIEMIKRLAIGLSEAILLLTGSLLVISQIPADRLGEACAAFGLIVVALGGLTTVLRKLANEVDVKGMLSMMGTLGAISVAMLSMTVALTLLIVPISVLGKMPWPQVENGLAAIIVGLASMGATLALMSKFGGTGKQILAVGASMMMLATALTILVIPITILGRIPFDMMAQGLLAVISGLAGMSVALAYVSKVGGSGKKILAVSASFILLAAALNLLIPPIVILGALPWSVLGAGLLAVGVALGELVVASYFAKGSELGLLALSAALVALGASVALVGTGLWAGAKAFALFMATLTALANLSPVTTKAIVTAMQTMAKGIASIIPEMATAFGEAAINFVVAMAEGVISSAPIIYEAINTLLLGSIESAVKISPVLAEGALTIIDEVLKSLVKHGPSIANSLFDFLIEVINILATKMPALVSAIVNVFQALLDSVFNELGKVNPDSLLKTAEAVGVLAVTMKLLGSIGGNVAPAMKGVLSLGVFVGELSLVLAAFGALKQIPGLQWLVDEGGDFLQSVAEAIGKFIGGFAGGMAEGFTASLPQIGTNLSQFMENVQPFIEGAKNINPEMLDGVNYLAQTILILTAADLLEGIASFITGGASLDKFGQMIADLADPIVAFAEKVKGIDVDATKGAAAAGAMLAAMASNLPKEGGFLDSIIGTSDVGEFGAQLEGFGEAIAKFADKVKDVKPEQVEGAASAGKMMAELANNLPNSGGWLGAIVGENDMDLFGKQLEGFGKSIVAFADTVKDLKADSVEGAATAGKMMVELANTIPNTGGAVSFFTGDNDMETFGKHLVIFGTCIVMFAEKVNGIDVSAVEGAATAGKMMTEMASSVPATGSVFDFLTGHSDLTTFGANLINFGKAMSDYSNSIAGINPEAVMLSAIAGAALAKLQNSLEATGGIASWWSGDSGLATFGDNLVIFGKALSAYSDSIGNVDTGRLEAVNKEIDGLVQTIQKIESVNATAVAGFVTAMQNLANTGIDSFVTAFTGANARASQAVITFMTAISAAVVVQSVTLQSTCTKEGNTIGQKICDGLIKGVKSKVPLVTSTVKNICTTVISTMRSSLPANVFNQIGQNVIQALINGMNSKKSTLISTVSSLCKEIIEKFKSGLDQKAFVEIGENMSQGIANGIKNKIDEIAKAAREAVEKAIAEAKKAADENSPSKKFFEIGKYFDLGLVEGIRAYNDEVGNAGAKLSSTAIDSVKNAISNLSDMVSNGLDSDPTIRPVMDLSGIQNGVSRINSMFSKGFKTTATISGKMNNNNNSISEVEDQNSGAPISNTYQFTQNNYSPKALSRIDIYRKTKNQFSAFKGALNGYDQINYSY